jgi:O-antigen/teichoic acid export membrane protein
LANRVSLSHVLKYTGVFGGVQAIKALASLIRNKLAAILLGSAGMGLNAVFQNIGEIIYSSTNLGVPFSSTRNLAEAYENDDPQSVSDLVMIIRTWAFAASILGGLLCLSGAWFLDWYFFSKTGRSHLLEIMLLSLYVMSMPMEAAECAILKGTRQLKSVATVESIAAFGTILFTTPFFWLWGVRGVAISLVICGWMVVGVHAYYSLRLFPYKVRPTQLTVFRKGLPLIYLGVPYMLASITTALCTSFVYHILSTESEIGLYKAAYSMILTYAGVAFVALENDYFPRLSAINSSLENRNYAVNQQIQVCCLIVGPLLCLMTVFMPWLIRLLLSSEFLAAVPMATAGVFFVYMRSINLPLAYLPLARGESVVYLVMEVISNFFAGLLVWFGYNYYGLLGCGIALSASGLIDSLILLTTYGVRYDFRLESKTILYLLIMAILLGLTVALTI